MKRNITSIQYTHTDILYITTIEPSSLRQSAAHKQHTTIIKNKSINICLSRYHKHSISHEIKAIVFCKVKHKIRINTNNNHWQSTNTHNATTILPTQRHCLARIPLYLKRETKATTQLECILPTCILYALWSTTADVVVQCYLSFTQCNYYAESHSIVVA